MPKQHQAENVVEKGRDARVGGREKRVRLPPPESRLRVDRMEYLALCGEAHADTSLTSGLTRFWMSPPSPPLIIIANFSRGPR
jgi:hypothetical protein